MLGKASADQIQGLVVSVRHLWLAANLAPALDLNDAVQHQELHTELALCAWMLLARW